VLGRVDLVLILYEEKAIFKEALIDYKCVGQNCLLSYNAKHIASSAHGKFN